MRPATTSWSRAVAAVGAHLGHHAVELAPGSLEEEVRVQPRQLGREVVDVLDPALFARGCGRRRRAGSRAVLAATGGQAQQQPDRACDAAARPSPSKHLDASPAQPCYTSAAAIALDRRDEGARRGGNHETARDGVDGDGHPAGGCALRSLPVTSYQEARQVLDAGIQAMGGLEALREIKDVSREGERHGVRAGPEPAARRPAARARDRDQDLPGLRGEPQRDATPPRPARGSCPAR